MGKKTKMSARNIAKRRQSSALCKQDLYSYRRELLMCARDQVQMQKKGQGQKNSKAKNIARVSAFTLRPMLILKF